MTDYCWHLQWLGEDVILYMAMWDSVRGRKGNKLNHCKDLFTRMYCQWARLFGFLFIYEFISLFRVSELRQRWFCTLSEAMGCGSMLSSPKSILKQRLLYYSRSLLYNYGPGQVTSGIYTFTFVCYFSLHSKEFSNAQGWRVCIWIALFTPAPNLRLE